MSRQMKHSGINWIDEIPASWDTIKLCYITDSIFSGKSPVYSEEKNTNYTLGQKNNQLYGIDFEGIKYSTDEHFSSCKESEFLHYGDILLNSLGTGSVGRIGFFDLPDKKVITDGHIIVIRPNSKIHNKYLFYYLRTLRKKLEDDAVGSTNQAFLTVPKIYKTVVPFPIISEQKKIADFLDSECAQIDWVIEKTIATIEGYKQLRQSIIDNAVTKGILPNRETKNSGINWIERIPNEWESINPKALFALRKDKAQAGEKQLTASQQYGVIYQDEYMELTGTRIVTVEKDFDILKHVEAGDFVISMRSFQGGLEYSEKSGSISSAYVMLIPNLDMVYPRFYKWLFKSSVYINALQSTSNLVRDGQAMRYSNFAQVRLYTVPLDEQKEIADYLDKKCAEIDTLIEKKTALLAEMESYKKSVIYEYVTGKKEVL